MPIISYKKVVETALNEVGYHGSKYNSKFSEYLDNIINSDGSKGWYNYPKSNECTWCAIFYDYCVAVNKGELSYEQARIIVCESENHKENTGAGVKEKAASYKKAGRWITQSNKATTADQIFLNGLNHTGIITGWDSTGFFYVDGSTTYDGKANSVGKKHISFNAKKIDGFGRPDWYRYENENVITPAEKFVVNTVTDPLRLRAYPSLSAPVICLMKKGSIVTFIEEAGDFYKVMYKTMIGYAHKDYLKKI